MLNTWLEYNPLENFKLLHHISFLHISLVEYFLLNITYDHSIIRVEGEGPLEIVLLNIGIKILELLVL